MITWSDYLETRTVQLIDYELTGKNFRAIREEYEITREELALEAGVEISLIESLEDGKTMWDPFLDKITDAMNRILGG